MRIHHWRHATLALNLSDLSLLVDPMLSPGGSFDAVPNSPSPRRNPLVDLPLNEKAVREACRAVDGVVVTHRHRDHWDPKAEEVIPKDKAIFCQPEDDGRLREAGFQQVMPVASEVRWRGIRIKRTGGQHGLGELGKRMGPVSGFVIRPSEGPGVYIAGDTVWCPEVEQALTWERPDRVIVYSGAAQFLEGGPITMTAEDVGRVCRALPEASVVAVHLEAMNHCVLSRAELRERLAREGLEGRVFIPADGEIMTL